MSENVVIYRVFLIFLSVCDRKLCEVFLLIAQIIVFFGVLS